MPQLNVTTTTATTITTTDTLTATKGIRLPTYTTAARPAAGTAGALIYNSTTNKTQVDNGTAWQEIGESGKIENWAGEAGRPAAPDGIGHIGYNTTDKQIEVYNGIDSGSQVWHIVSANAALGSTAGNPATSAQAIYAQNNSFTDGLYYIATPNGGTQQIYCINSNSRGWMVMGKFDSDASQTVANNPIATASGTVDNNSGTVISCDFGDFQPTYNRFIGTNDITQWENTRNLDFYYGVPSGRAFKNFWTSGQSSGMPRVRRNGFAVDGGFDSRGRWQNTGMTFMQMSDTDVTISESYFTSPSNSLTFHNASDAKFSISHSQSAPGQDEEKQTSFGYDDNQRHFMDIYSSYENNNTNRRDYSTAVYVLLS